MALWSQRLVRALDSLVSLLVEILEDVLPVMVKEDDTSSTSNDESNSSVDDDSIESSSSSFALFDLTLDQAMAAPEKTREKLKKAHHKLSLKQGRNNGSAESNAKTQEINQAYQQCQEELDRMQGILVVGEENATTSETQDDNDDVIHSNDPPAVKRAKRQRKKKKQKEERKRLWKQRKAALRQAEKLQELHRELDFEIDKLQRYPPVYPDKAHVDWKRRQEEYSRQQDAAPLQERSSTKPKHALLEHSTHVLAVTLRLGHDMEAFGPRLQDCMVEYAVGKHLGPLRRLLRRRPTIETNVCKFVQSCPLDTDGNTLLHYIAYYESVDALRLLMTSPQDSGAAMLCKNKRGMLPMDFCCERNEFYNMMQHYTTAAMQDCKRKQKERIQRVVKIVCAFLFVLFWFLVVQRFGWMSVIAGGVQWIKLLMTWMVVVLVRAGCFLLEACLALLVFLLLALYSRRRDGIEKPLQQQALVVVANRPSFTAVSSLPSRPAPKLFGMFSCDDDSVNDYLCCLLQTNEFQVCGDLHDHHVAAAAFD